MKKVLLLCGILLSSLHVVPMIQIPKSSLEQIKNKIISQLEDARKNRDNSAITKYEKELTEIDKKIKKFEIEWLEFEKSKLMAKGTDAASADMQEIDSLLAERK